ncbi:Abi family protein [Thiomicrorhabdus hydrogeniphila]
MNSYHQHKPSTSLSEQLRILKSRGLIWLSSEQTKVEHHLSHISYFRLSAYMRPFYVPNQNEHHFVEGTTFSDVLALYIFDRELRLILLDAIERIEVSLRAVLGNVLAENHGAHGYLNPNIFDTRYNHEWLMRELANKAQDRNCEIYLRHYRQQYPEAPDQPPVWMGMEVLTFKQVSTLFSKLRIDNDKHQIEQYFGGLTHALLSKWFRAISDMRNLCAHHSRIWNREFGSRPAIPRRVPREILLPQLDTTNSSDDIDPYKRLYWFVSVIQIMMNFANPNSEWKLRFIEHINSHSHIPFANMGFPENWQDDPFWN